LLKRIDLHALLDKMGSFSRVACNEGLKALNIKEILCTMQEQFRHG